MKRKTRISIKEGLLPNWYSVIIVCDHETFVKGRLCGRDKLMRRISDKIKKIMICDTAEIRVHIFEYNIVDTFDLHAFRIQK